MKHEKNEGKCQQIDFSAYEGKKIIEKKVGYFIDWDSEIIVKWGEHVWIFAANLTNIGSDESGFSIPSLLPV